MFVAQMTKNKFLVALTTAHNIKSSCIDAVNSNNACTFTKEENDNYVEKSISNNGAKNVEELNVASQEELIANENIVFEVDKDCEKLQLDNIGNLDIKNVENKNLKNIESLDTNNIENLDSKNINILSKDEQNSNATLDKKMLNYWVGLFAVILGGLESFLLAFNVKIEVNLIIEALSLILCSLVYVGVLKKNKKSDNLQEEIKKELSANIKTKQEKQKEKVK